MTVMDDVVPCGVAEKKAMETLWSVRCLDNALNRFQSCHKFDFIIHHPIEDFTKRLEGNLPLDWYFAHIAVFHTV